MCILDMKAGNNWCSVWLLPVSVATASRVNLQEQKASLYIKPGRSFDLQTRANAADSAAGIAASQNNQ